MEQVILVNSKDHEIGQAEKLDAHERGLLHRAFSVLILNSSGQMLLQKRAEGKYHSGGLWTNACCSHPRPNENTADAAKRRLMEEMGIELSPTFVYKFVYKTELDNNLIEHELDHVFIGHYDGEPSLDSKEASDWKFEDIEKIKSDIDSNPENYTIWFRIIMENIDRHLAQPIS